MSNGVWLEKKPWSYYIIFNISSEGTIYRISYQIYIKYIFNKKKKLSAKIILTNQNCAFCQIPNTNVIFLTHKRIYMYILQYPVLLVFNYSPLSIKYTLIKFIISCQKCFFFHLLNGSDMRNTYTGKWYRYKYGQPCWRYPSILQFRALWYVMYSFVGCYHFWNCDKSNAVNLKFLLNRWHND